MHWKLTQAFSHPNIPWFKFKSILAFSIKIAPIENKKAIMIFYRIKCFNIPKRIIDLFNAKYRHPGILDSNKYKSVYRLLIILGFFLPGTITIQSFL